jgi:hypothetical protein
MNWPLLLIKVTLLFLAAFGATALLRRSAASTRHLIWSGLFASVVALPLLSATLPRIDIPVPAAWQIAVPYGTHRRRPRHAPSPPATLQWWTVRSRPMRPGRPSLVLTGLGTPRSGRVRHAFC